MLWHVEDVHGIFFCGRCSPQRLQERSERLGDTADKADELRQQGEEFSTAAG